MIPVAVNRNNSNAYTPQLFINETLSIDIEIPKRINFGDNCALNLIKLPLSDTAISNRLSTPESSLKRPKRFKSYRFRIVKGFNLTIYNDGTIRSSMIKLKTFFFIKNSEF